MQTKELIGFSVKPDWTPVTNIKPHHVTHWIPKGFIDKFKLYTITYMQTLYFAVKDSQYHTSYYEDVYGSGEALQNNQRQRLKESFLQELRSLPANAVVQLELAPDGICRSCVTGKHCRATNFRAFGRRWDSLALEEPNLIKIRRRLLERGFQQDTDFKVIPVNTELLDYRGENLWANLQPAPPINVQYNALLVRMGALRRIVDNKF